MQWVNHALIASWRPEFNTQRSTTMANECTFIRLNPCHLRGIGYHYSDTRVWVDTSRHCDVLRHSLQVRPHDEHRSIINVYVSVRTCRIAISFCAVILTPPCVGLILIAIGEHIFLSVVRYMIFC